MMRDETGTCSECGALTHERHRDGCSFPLRLRKGIKERIRKNIAITLRDGGTCQVCEAPRERLHESSCIVNHPGWMTVADRIWDGSIFVGGSEEIRKGTVNAADLEPPSNPPGVESILRPQISLEWGDVIFNIDQPEGETFRISFVRDSAGEISVEVHQEVKKDAGPVAIDWDPDTLMPQTLSWEDVLEVRCCDERWTDMHEWERHLAEPLMHSWTIRAR